MPQQHVSTFVQATEEEPEVVKKEKDKDDFALETRAWSTKGKELFGPLGCASCHQMKEEARPSASTLKAPALGEAGPDKGCLADKPGKNVPRYALPAKAKSDIAAALQASRTPRTEADGGQERPSHASSPSTATPATSATRSAGRRTSSNKPSQTTQPEMGDEGRMPPPLDGVGAKLKPDYLKQILDKGVDDRPYMHTRMPGFGTANVGHLVEAFAELDKLPSRSPTVKFDRRPTQGEGGRPGTWSAAQAFGCIKCHTFNGKKAEGVQGIDMMLMPKRLKRDWFHAYCSTRRRSGPARACRGLAQRQERCCPRSSTATRPRRSRRSGCTSPTASEAALPLGHGQAVHPADRRRRRRSSTATSSRGPAPRAIGVGYPEKVNLAFDANDLRLAMIWQGAFIDAARHWTDRGVGFEGAAGRQRPQPAGRADVRDAGEGRRRRGRASRRRAGLEVPRLPARRRTTGRRSSTRWTTCTVEDFPNAGRDKEGQPT